MQKYFCKCGKDLTMQSVQSNIDNIASRVSGGATKGISEVTALADHLYDSGVRDIEGMSQVIRGQDFNVKTDPGKLVYNPEEINVGRKKPDALDMSKFQ